MKVGIAADHAGVEYFRILVEEIKSKGYDVIDLTGNEAYEDYPDAAEVIAKAVLQGKIERGILICGSGVGVSVAANKYPGIRAAVCHDSYSAHQGVEHDRMNVLCLGERIIGPELAKELTGIFLEARFTSEERHVRRSGKIDEIEKEYLKPS